MDRTYSHIDLDERRRIARWRTAKLSVDVIAEKLGRHRSTIFRELKRNQFNDDEIKDLNGYYCTIADQKCRERRSKQRKLIRYDELRQSVIDHIRRALVEKKSFGNICRNVVPDAAHVMPGVIMDAAFRLN
ncbi:homeo-like domain protein [Brucella pseudogrignonensis]|uniref:Homeo-like domain protein n=1 Tax=Brucella pseudogrignonensis TaxID=419475 RepID=A0A256G847_9HYPH|nr:homeo-like domain protein [Brucella pseudogrignonensis]